MYRVIENHKDFLLIDKHPGIDFHKGSKPAGLVDILKSDLVIKELYTVHRLDRVTSGLLLFAKTSEAAKDLSRQFRNRQVEKYYLAISDGRPKKKQGLVKGDMERARRGGWKLLRSMQKPAITQFLSYSLGDRLRLFILKPHTGKTHQLRVALKSIGAPVLGDPLYHKKGDSRPDRTYLHSYALRFYLGGAGYEFVHRPDRGELFNSDIIVSWINTHEKPWELKWPSVRA
jgi:tRNA pseudouridine32 synthase/23S rRNA pseudouridine746 synthase